MQSTPSSIITMNSIRGGYKKEQPFPCSEVRGGGRKELQVQDSQGVNSALCLPSR